MKHKQRLHENMDHVEEKGSNVRLLQKQEKKVRIVCFISSERVTIKFRKLRKKGDFPFDLYLISKISCKY